MSLATLQRHNVPSYGFDSKTWDVFKNMADLRIVITVCGNAAGEVCPIFPGSPVKAHWGVPDPAHFQGTQAEIEAEFDRVYGMLEKRVKALVALPVESMDNDQLKTKLDEIGLIA